MSQHAPALAIELDNHPLPNQPFFSWLRNHTALFIGQIVALLTLVYTLAALIYYMRHTEVDTNYLSAATIHSVVIYAHLIILVVFIAVLIRISEVNEIGRYRSTLVKAILTATPASATPNLEKDCVKKVRHFKYLFLGFWCLMLALYIGFALEPPKATVNDNSNQAQSALSGDQRKQAEPAPAPLWNLPAVFLCKICGAPKEDHSTPSPSPTPLSPPPSSDQKIKDPPKPLNCDQVVQRLLFPFVHFCLNNLSLLFIFFCFLVLYLPPESTRGEGETTDSAHSSRSSRNSQWRIGIVFIAFIGVLTLMFPVLAFLVVKFSHFNTETLPHFETAFNALSGALNGVVVALLVARLDSKLIGLPSWLICMLYIYAAVQPLFVVFELDTDPYKAIATAVLVVVFIFKIYFFLIIVYTLQAGRLFNYFLCSRVLNHHVDEQKEIDFQTASRKSDYVINQFLSRSAKQKLSAAVSSFESSSTSRTQPETTAKSPSIEPAPEGACGHLKSGIRRVRNIITRSVDWIATKIYRSVDWVMFKIYRSVACIAIMPGGLGVSRFLGWSAILFFVGSLLIYCGLIDHEWLFAAISAQQGRVEIAHICLLFFIIVGILLARPISVHRQGQDRWRTFEMDQSKIIAKRHELQLRRFKHSFLWFWCAMLMLYGVFLLEPQIKGSAGPWEANKQSQGSLLPLTVSAHFTMTIKSESANAGKTSNENSPANAEKTATPAREPTLEFYRVFPAIRYSFICFLLNNIIVFCVFRCFLILYVPLTLEKFDEKNRTLFGYWVLVMVLITFLVPVLVILLKGGNFTEAEVKAIPRIFAAVGGTLTAVAYALLIARLDSRLIGVRSFLIAVLYGYGALQPLFVIFGEDAKFLQAMQTSALATAFLFKVCWFLIIRHVLVSGDLSCHLLDAPFLNTSVNSVFGNQFEIRAYSIDEKLFGWSILRNNMVTYQAEETHDSKIKCEAAISRFRDSHNKGLWWCDPDEKFGTHWVRIMDLRGTICESTSLRTAEEAKTLMRESKQMLPYCKYNRG